ncbi:MAG: type II 3-dehydroquinate dehydratase [Gammaproteobacteria bacterium]|nr:type II 3-dehydroquinate dehydratase [Gammaproteobacteria bacterium]
MQILLINGPNLNLLGQREPERYGAHTWADIYTSLEALASTLGVKLSHFQSNAEHELINTIQEARNKADFIILNAGAYTHTSIALRDALLAVQVPFIEVHLSNIYARESFRHHSYLTDVAVGIISGLGAMGYECALRAAHHRLTTLRGE